MIRKGLAKATETSEHDETISNKPLHPPQKIDGLLADRRNLKNNSTYLETLADIAEDVLQYAYHYSELQRKTRNITKSIIKLQIKKITNEMSATENKKHRIKLRQLEDQQEQILKEEKDEMMRKY